MTERERLMSALERECMKVQELDLKCVVDFILADRKRICEPLVNIINSDRKNNYDYLLNACYKSIKLSGGSMSQDEKEVEELAKLFPTSIPFYKCKAIAEHILDNGYRHQPPQAKEQESKPSEQCPNAYDGVPKAKEGLTSCLSKEQFAKELFNSLGGCVIKETTGYTIYDKWIKVKEVGSVG